MQARIRVDDLQLVRAALAGEDAALDALVQRLACVPRILAVKNRRMGSPFGPEELGDLVQDVLTTVWRKLPDYRGAGALESWVFPFCVFELLNAARRKRRAESTLGDLDELAHGREVRARDPLDFEPLYRGLDRLRSPQARCLRLRWFEHASFEEIAERMRIPISTAKSHYYRGMDRLRTLLAPLLRREQR